MLQNIRHFCATKFIEKKQMQVQYDEKVYQKLSTLRNVCSIQFSYCHHCSDSQSHFIFVGKATTTSGDETA